ncbi:hypothetical protein [Pseudonocardia oceani]|nr:hypothetical protein [Pseudonocardia oceani]
MIGPEACTRGALDDFLVLALDPRVTERVLTGRYGTEVTRFVLR